MRSFIFFMALVSVFTSCNKDQSSPYGHNHKCKIGGMCVTLSKEYTPDEIDSVYIAKYTSGTSFATPLEDTIFTADAANTIFPDYTIPAFTYPYFMYQGYDYEISLPSTGQVFRVQEILNPPDSMGGGAANGKEAECYAFIYQYTATGGPTSLTQIYKGATYGVIFGK